VRWLDDTRAERSGSTTAEVRAASEREIPLRRYGEPIELAEVAVFLCSKAGRYVSGTAQLVDGGLVRAL
jgi:3-oxoacyl-[acyl-carrier protein] reductase